MKSLFISDIHKREPQADVTLQCWLRSRRHSGAILFLDVADSTGVIQCVIERQRVSDNVWTDALRTPIESAVKVSGTVVSHPKHERELSVHDLAVIGLATLNVSPAPRELFNIFDESLTELMLSKRHLYLRNPRVMAMLQFRSILMSEVRKWFEANRFTEIDAPILTPVPLYEDGSAVAVNIHDEQVFLTQCVGYYLEAAVHAFERVYNMGPSFRGEESRSPRHLMEYHHIKAEIAFANLGDIIGIVESLIGHVSRVCWERAPHLLKVLNTTMCLDGLEGPYPRISYADAVIFLQGHGSDIAFGKGLSGPDERKLSESFSTPFWVTGIPRSVEPFPYCIDPEDPRVARVADLIASNGMGELLGVAEKIHDLDMLDVRLSEKGKSGDQRYEWVREVHQLGCVPHAAFGMGVERLIRWLLNVPHVRDAIPFPRIFRRRVYP